MGDHTVYRRAEGETTEWDDLQVKYGNKAPPEPASKPEPFAPRPNGEARDREWLERQSEEGLEDLDDDFKDDAILEKIRFRPFGHAKSFIANLRRQPRACAHSEAMGVVHGSGESGWSS